jgi:hypothetical protein
MQGLAILNNNINDSILPLNADTSRLTGDVVMINDTITKPKFTLKNIIYKLGVCSEKANGQSGLGVVAQIVFTKKWSTIIGANALTVNNAHFENENDFFHSHRQPFKNEYRIPAHDTTSITNIGIKNKIFQIPISIIYTKPLKNKFDLCFSIGTTLDISGKQHVDYRRKENAGLENSRSLDVKQPILIINNASISAGIQKNWKNISLLFSPYISPQITPVSYKKERIYYGAKLMALYNF